MIGEEVTPAGTRPREEIALLDIDGVIVAVNAAWDEFCASNDGVPELCGVGRSYLAVCEAASQDPLASATAAAIRVALRGELAMPAALLVPCDSPSVPRWFDVYVSSRFDDTGRCIGAMIVISRTLAPDARPAALEEVIGEHLRVVDELHQHTLQQLYAVAMGLCTLARRLDSPEHAGQLTGYLDAIDQTTRRLRITVKNLAPRAGTLVQTRERQAPTEN